MQKIPIQKLSKQRYANIVQKYLSINKLLEKFHPHERHIAI